MAAKRERINDSQYARRDSGGKFKEVESVRKAAAQDQKRKAKTASKPGMGDKGDRKSR